MLVTTPLGQERRRRREKEEISRLLAMSASVMAVSTARSRSITGSPTVSGKRDRLESAGRGRRAKRQRKSAPIETDNEESGSDWQGGSEDDEEDGDSHAESTAVELVGVRQQSNTGETPTASTSALVVSPASTDTKPKRKPNRRTCYPCPHPGCTKSYTKPVRLEEHIRSHTGERPFVCAFEGCDASYLRENHLQAHQRTHKKEEDKPFACEVKTRGGDSESEVLCGKRFWTTQHLKRHVQSVHEKNKGLYECEHCSESFNKHNKLRSHVSSAHMPSGTKPYICPHHSDASSPCPLSFSTAQKLKSHLKTHDASRYVCMHASHGTTSFPTWSALQEHNKAMHPPICKYPGCRKANEVFVNRRALRRHVVHWHAEEEAGRVGGQGESSEEAKEEETAAEEETEYTEDEACQAADIDYEKLDVREDEDSDSADSEDENVSQMLLDTARPATNLGCRTARAASIPIDPALLD